MDSAEEVLAAAHARAAALVSADRAGLEELLHPDFRWTTHRGLVLERDAYVDSNTGGQTAWLSQTLVSPVVTVVGDTAVLHCTAVDEVDGSEGPELYRMPMTQVWTRGAEQWTCLAGHAGPLLPL